MKNLAPLRFCRLYAAGCVPGQVGDADLPITEIEGVFSHGGLFFDHRARRRLSDHNNFNYTRELALFCTQYGHPVVYASSCATYGDGSHGYIDDESAIEALRPMNMYGYSKQLFDLWAKRNGLLKSIVGCKFSNVWGPNERHKGEMRSVVCRAFEQISDCGKLKLFKSYRPEYADGEQKRDFLYVKDAVDMVLYLFHNPMAHGLYNIGSGRAETWNALAAAAFAALDRPIDIDTLRCRKACVTVISTTPRRRWGSCGRWVIPAKRLHCMTR